MKIYGNACNKENLKTLKYHIFKETLDLSTVYSKCGHEYNNYLKRGQKSITNHIIMPQENTSQEFRLININKTRNYFIKEIN